MHWLYASINKQFHENNLIWFTFAFSGAMMKSLSCLVAVSRRSRSSSRVTRRTNLDSRESSENNLLSEREIHKFKDMDGTYYTLGVGKYACPCVRNDQKMTMDNQKIISSRPHKDQVFFLGLPRFPTIK